MTILLIHPDPACHCDTLPQPAATEALCCRGFDAPGTLLSALRDVHGTDIDLVVIDAGAHLQDCTQADGHALLGALEGLPMPWIEVQHAAAPTLDEWLHPRHAARVVVRDGGSDRYALPLAVARHCVRVQAGR